MEHDDRTAGRLGSAAAAVVAVGSVFYAVAYLIITPSAQRHSNVGAFFRSYLAHPAGLRIASVCLIVSGVLASFAVVALRAALSTDAADGPLVRWATTAGVVAGLGAAAPRLGGLLSGGKSG